MQHVIVGTGPAGVIAAETLRSKDAACRITLIGDEPEPPYSRMALPYVLSGRIAESGTWLRKSEAHFAARNIEFIQARVASIDTKQKKISLEDGGALAFDKLLLATGSRPLRPPVPGMDLDKVSSCWTLQDGRNIAAQTQPGTKVVLIGAGFIGCIILEALALRGVKLTVVEMADRMVPRMMNRTAGGLIKRWCEAKGIEVFTSAQVAAIRQAGEGLRVSLEKGPDLQADMVIAATGVGANMQCLAGSGIEVDRGVLVNDRLQSSHADIYAAGDVCQGRDFSTGEYSVQAIQPTAAEHGRIAAMNMAGRALRHQGSVNMNVLDTLGLISASYGLWQGAAGGEAAELCDEHGYRYINLQFADDVLVGAQSLGLTQHVGVLRGLIQGRLRLGKWKARLLDDPTRIMEAYLANTQAIAYNAAVL